jgi:hypothetical protein
MASGIPDEWRTDPGSTWVLAIRNGLAFQARDERVAAALREADGKRSRAAQLLVNELSVYEEVAATGIDEAVLTNIAFRTLLRLLPANPVDPGVLWYVASRSACGYLA